MREKSIMATAALVLTDGLGEFGRMTPGVGNTRLAGLTLTERAVLAAHRAGIDRIHITGADSPDEKVLARLRARGMSITCAREHHRPFADLPAETTLVVLPVVTVVKAAAISALVERARLAPAEAASSSIRGPECDIRFL